MQFIEGARVFDVNNKEVGHITHVVMNPSTGEVTDVVVRQGVIFTEDKVIPFHLFKQTTQDRATLSDTVDQLDDLPRFEETEYIPAEAAKEAAMPGQVVPPMVGSYYWYPPLGYPAGGALWTPYADRNYVQVTTKNIPEGTIALKEGARVVSVDDKHVGNIENVIVDPDTSHVTHFVISQGLLFKSQKVVPTFWVKHTLEDEVYLTVTADFLEDLPDYNS